MKTETELALEAENEGAAAFVVAADTSSTTFEQETPDSGTFYHWSVAANWSNGIPQDGSTVVESAQGIDDIAGLSLSALQLGGDLGDTSLTVDVVADSLTVGSVSGGAGTGLQADSYDPQVSLHAPVTVTVEATDGAGVGYSAVGAGARFIDQGTTDLGEVYSVAINGFLETFAAPSSASSFTYFLNSFSTAVSGTLAFADPGATTDAPLENVAQGDGLELPGTIVEDFAFGSGSLVVTTDKGRFAFTDVTFTPGSPVNGQNPIVNGFDTSLDPSTGLLDLTFTAGPAIHGTATGQKTTDQGAIAPFANVAITDAYAGQTETVSVTLSAAANGTLIDLGSGSYDAATGVYSVSGSTAAVTKAIDGLVFEPTGHQVAAGKSVQTEFAIAVTDTVGVTETNDATSVVATNAEKLATAISFDGDDGAHPTSGLIADANGNLVGTTLYGGSDGDGTAFEIKLANGGYAATPTTLTVFDGANGQYPYAGLTADGQGDLVGASLFGGADDDGEIFELAETAGSGAAAPTPVVTFDGLDGAQPQSALITDAAGDLFGTTISGAESYDPYGTVFEIAKTASGYASEPLLLAVFDWTNGTTPEGGLVRDEAGDLFGTTYGDTATGDAYGTVFEIAKTTSGYGQAVTLLSFNSSDGANPAGSLSIDAAGDLFGATARGGANGDGTVFEVVDNGGVYATAPTTLADFDGTDGMTPIGGVIADATGDLFGTTARGGASNDGTVFELEKTGKVYESAPTVLVSFNGENGANPEGGLTADAAGDLSGTTYSGGAYGDGTAFVLSAAGFQVETGGGVGQDGYIEGATVTYGNGVTTTTDASGAFTAAGGTGPLVLTGGTDTSTDLAFTGALRAPAGSTVISPLTTLVEAVIDATGDATATADAAVVAALGLPTGTDLTTLDAVAGTLAGDTTAAAAYEAGAALQNAITLIGAAGGSASEALSAFAQIAVAGASLRLTDPTTITTVAGQAGLDGAAASAVASIVSATTNALSTQMSADPAPTPYQLFVDIAGASLAEQGNGAAALMTAAAGSDAAVTNAADDYMSAIPATLATDDMRAAANTACYMAGTLILTDKGETPVERLTIGDRVVTASGMRRPIKWIGSRSYAGRFANANPGVLPICFKAGSLGDDTPRRDLWVSPKHAMFLDGVLIPAEHLVNGVSVTHVDRVEVVDYFHIELTSHDVIVAEGAASETFVDDASRAMFHNARTYARLYPEADPAPAIYCAPRIEEGFALEAARRRIADRAGLSSKPTAQDVALRGTLDRADAYRIEGWAQALDNPEAPVCLDVFVDDILVKRVMADRYRPDLLAAGIGSGDHSFCVTWDEPLSPEQNHVVDVRRSSDGSGLWCSPKLVVAARAAA